MAIRNRLTRAAATEGVSADADAPAGGVMLGSSSAGKLRGVTAIIAGAVPRTRDWKWAILAVALVALLLAPGRVPITRSQEARVLETARGMVEEPSLERVLVPKLAGQLRLQKPPLAYWLSAGSFAAFGVSLESGRLPGILAAWGTVVLVYVAGVRRFNGRAAVFAAAMLVSSYLFYRYGRLAETDTLATFFVTGACIAWWEATCAESSRRRFVLFHAGAALAAGAAMAKGPPAFFPLLFLVLFAGSTEARWRTLGGFVRSGAVLTFAVPAVAWYVYLASRGLMDRVIYEVDTLASGRNHGGSFLRYVPYLVVATAPWSGFVGAAIALAGRRWKEDDDLRALLCWCAAILLPLCLVGNKQLHYLIPLMPPAMLLAGVYLDRVLSGREIGVREAGFGRGVIFATAALAVAGAVGLPLAAARIVGRAEAVDYVLAGALAAAAVCVLATFRRLGAERAAIALLATAVVVVPLTLGLWMPRVVVDDVGPFASALRGRFGAGARYVYYQQYPRLSLNFNLRRDATAVFTPRALKGTLDAAPGTVVLCLTESGDRAPVTPPGMELAMKFPGREAELYAYVVAPGNAGPAE